MFAGEMRMGVGSMPVRGLWSAGEKSGEVTAIGVSATLPETVRRRKQRRVIVIRSLIRMIWDWRE